MNADNTKDNLFKKFMDKLDSKNKRFYNDLVNNLDSNNLEIDNTTEINDDDYIKNTEKDSKVKIISSKSSSIIINPLPNENIDIFVENNLSFKNGNNVIVESENLLNKFEAIVSYYDVDIGLLKLSKIKNIIGVFNNFSSYTVTIKINRSKKYYPLSGIENGIYYRGKSEIINNTAVTIKLPENLLNITNDFTINITPIYTIENNNNNNETLFVSEIENNEFNVYGKNRKFFWIIFGKKY